MNNGVFMIIRILAVCVLFSFASAIQADDAPSNGGDDQAQSAAVAKPTLDPEMSALRDQVRSTLAAHARQQFNTRDNTATEIMSRCIAFGCDSEVRLNSSDGQPINGITCLCWNYPCGGYEMLGRDRSRIAPRIGYGHQEQPGEFLAMLALSRVPNDYPVRVGKEKRNVADLVEAAKLACRQGTDKSLALVGLSYYVDEPVWKNESGEEWSIERIIEEELARPIAGAPEGGLNRLLGLGYAVERCENQKQPIEGQLERARKFVADYQDYALKMQNPDGSWGPNFLAARGASNDPADQLRATGRVLEWLAITLPNDRLQAPAMVNAANYLTRLLSSSRYRWNAQALDTQEIVSLGHALHALSVYDRRVFKPCDPDEKSAEETAKPESA